MNCLFIVEKMGNNTFLCNGIRGFDIVYGFSFVFKLQEFLV